MKGLGLRRVGALFVFASLLASITVIGAPGALAHHPEVGAESRCADAPVIDYVATSWSSGAKGENANIGIYVDGVWQASGAFTEANGYTFSGTIDASAWAGKTVTVLARADGPWGNGKAAGDSRSTSVTVTGDCGATTTTTSHETTTTTIPGTYVPGNPTCEDLGYANGIKSDPPGIDETIDGVFFDYNGLRSVSVSSSSGAIHAVIVKGGNGAQAYTSDYVDLVAPLNNGGQRPDISHVTACVDSYEPTTTTTEQETTTTTQATTTTTQATTTTTKPVGDAVVWVNVGRCEEVHGESLTPVWIRIEPAGSASVTLRTPEGPIVFTESGSVRLVPGRYFWEATATEGYELTGRTEGSFRTAHCSTTDTMVAVVMGHCVYDAEAGVSVTDVTFRIAPGGTATVLLEGPGGPYEIDGSGERLLLAPGVYKWVATAADGYSMVGPAEGMFTIGDCSPQCTALIGDAVWIDMNPRNGIQDEGEERVAGVAVELQNEDGVTLAVTSTDENGHYEFTDLCEGVYRVQFELPDLKGLVNEAWTIEGAGDSLVDSNADASGRTTLISLARGAQDLSWDAGVVGESVSPTTVTTLPSTTSTTALVTTTTVGDTTSSTIAPLVSTTTVPPVTASTLPFTGFEIQATAMLGLLVLAGGGALLMAVGRRSEESDPDSIGTW